MPPSDQLIGMGVSGGQASGVFVEYTKSLDDRYVGLIVLVSDLDKRVADLSSSNGIISCAGGITSHGAVLAREFGIPCIVVHPSQDLHESLGKRVHIDGWEGTLTVDKADS